MFIKQEAVSEVVINASVVGDELGALSRTEGEYYEFVLNESLHLVECGRVASSAQGIVTVVNDVHQALAGKLFELEHVRVNPRIDNSVVLNNLAAELERSGVHIIDPPASDMMMLCFKPLGELSEVVRFYLAKKTNSLVFLSQSVQLRVIK